MKDNVHHGELPDGMEKFIKTRTYLDATDLRNDENIQLFKKKLLFSMPRIPISKLKSDSTVFVGPNVPPLFRRILTYGSSLFRFSFTNWGHLNEYAE